MKYWASIKVFLWTCLHLLGYFLYLKVLSFNGLRSQKRLVSPTLFLSGTSNFDVGVIRRLRNSRWKEITVIISLCDLVREKMQFIQKIVPEKFYEWKLSSESMWKIVLIYWSELLNFHFYWSTFACTQFTKSANIMLWFFYLEQQLKISRDNKFVFYSLLPMKIFLRSIQKCLKNGDSRTNQISILKTTQHKNRLCNNEIRSVPTLEK